MYYKRFIQLGILSVFLVLSGCAGYYSHNGYGYDSRSDYYAPYYDNYGYSYPGFHARGDIDGDGFRGGNEHGFRGEHGGGYER